LGEEKTCHCRHAVRVQTRTRPPVAIILEHGVGSRKVRAPTGRQMRKPSDGEQIGIDIGQDSRVPRPPMLRCGNELHLLLAQRFGHALLLLPAAWKIGESTEPPCRE